MCRYRANLVAAGQANSQPFWSNWHNVKHNKKSLRSVINNKAVKSIGAALVDLAIRILSVVTVSLFCDNKVKHKKSYPMNVLLEHL